VRSSESIQNPRPQIPHERESEIEGVPCHSNREGEQCREEREERGEEDRGRRGLD
jgi:hypothetical protein